MSVIVDSTLESPPAGGTTLVDGDFELSPIVTMLDGDMEFDLGPSSFIDGDMEAVGVGAEWLLDNTPTLTKEAGTPHSGLQHLRILNSGDVYQGCYQSALTNGRTYHIHGWARGDGGAGVPVVCNDNTPDSLAKLWTGTSSTAWQEFDVTFVSSGTNVAFGADLDQDLLIVDYDDITIDDVSSLEWIAYQAIVSKEKTSPHTGLECLRIAYDGFASALAYQVCLDIGKTYYIKGYARSSAAGGTPFVTDGAGTIWTGVNSTSWQTFELTFVSAGTAVGLWGSLPAGTYVEFDDIEVLDVGIYDDWSSIANVLAYKSPIDPHTGTRCLRLSYDGVHATGNVLQSTVLTSGAVYRCQGWARGDGAGGIPKVAEAASGDIIWTGTSTHSWQHFDVTLVCGGGEGAVLYATSLSAGKYVEFDDMYIDDVTAQYFPSVNSNVYRYSNNPSPYEGSRCLVVKYSNSADGYAHQLCLRTGQTYRVSCWACGDGTSSPVIKNGSTVLWSGTASTEWQHAEFIFKATSPEVRLGSNNLSTGHYVAFDDIDFTLAYAKARNFLLAPTQNDRADGMTVPFNESRTNTISASEVVDAIGLDTSGFDAYRQGVELTDEKYFQLGTGAKIHSGEIGSRLPQTQFGMDNGSNQTRKIPFDDK